MENATDALHMAFGVLIFVLALSISISSFGLAQSTSQYIIELRDRENDYTYVESSTDTKRIVGIETIIPTMYRAYRENYIIVFDGAIDTTDGSGKTVLFQKKSGNASNAWINVYRLNLAESELAIRNQSDATKFIDQLLYGGLNGTETSYFPKINAAAGNLQSSGIYGKIKDKKFIETTGIYYIDDIIQSSVADDTILSSDANKTEKRVITYTLTN